MHIQTLHIPLHNPTAPSDPVHLPTPLNIPTLHIPLPRLRLTAHSNDLDEQLGSQLSSEEIESNGPAYRTALRAAAARVWSRLPVSIIAAALRRESAPVPIPPTLLPAPRGAGPPPRTRASADGGGNASASAGGGGWRARAQKRPEPSSEFLEQAAREWARQQVKGDGGGEGWGGAHGPILRRCEVSFDLQLAPSSSSSSSGGAAAAPASAAPADPELEQEVGEEQERAQEEAGAAALSELMADEGLSAWAQLLGSVTAKGVLASDR